MKKQKIISSAIMLLALAFTATTHSGEHADRTNQTIVENHLQEIQPYDQNDNRKIDFEEMQNVSQDLGDGEAEYATFTAAGQLYEREYTWGQRNQENGNSVSLDSRKTFQEGETYEVGDTGTEIEVNEIESDGTAVLNGGYESGFLVDKGRSNSFTSGGQKFQVINCEADDNSFTGKVLQQTENPKISNHCDTEYDWYIKNVDTGEKVGKKQLIEVSEGETLNFVQTGTERVVEITSSGKLNLTEGYEGIFGSRKNWKAIAPGFHKTIDVYRNGETHETSLDLFVCSTDAKTARIAVMNNFDQDSSIVSNCREDLASRETIDIALEGDPRRVFIGNNSETTLNVNDGESLTINVTKVSGKSVTIDGKKYYFMKNPSDSFDYDGEKAKIRLKDDIFLQHSGSNSVKLMSKTVDDPKRTLNWQINGRYFYFIRGDSRFQIHHDGKTVEAYLKGGGPSERKSRFSQPYRNADFMVEGKKLFEYCSPAEDNFETISGITFLRVKKPPEAGCGTIREGIVNFKIKTRDANRDNSDLKRKYEERKLELKPGDTFTVYRGGDYRVSSGQGLPLTRINLREVQDGKANVFITNRAVGTFQGMEDCGFRRGILQVSKGDVIAIPEEEIYLKVETINSDGIHRVKFKAVESSQSALKPQRKACENTGNENQRENPENEEGSQNQNSDLNLYSTSVTNNYGEMVMNQRSVNVSPNSQVYRATASVSNNAESSKEVSIRIKQNGETLVEKTNNIQPGRGTTFSFDIQKEDVSFTEGSATLTFQVAGTELSETKTLKLEEPEYEGKRIELGQKVTVSVNDALVFEGNQLNIQRLQDNPLIAVKTGDGKLGTVTFPKEGTEYSPTELRFQNGTYYIKGCNYNQNSQTAEIIISETPEISCEEDMDNEKEVSLELSKQEVALGERLTIQGNVPDSYSEEYRVVIENPSGGTIRKEPTTENDFETTHTTGEQGTPGEWTVKILPASSGILEGIINSIGSIIANPPSKTFTVTQEGEAQQAEWIKYCKNQGYGNQKINLKQKTNCIEEEIIPKYFETRESEIPENTQPANSICQNLLSQALNGQYTYNTQQTGCIRDSR